MKKGLLLLLALSLGLNAGLLYVRVSDRTASGPERPGSPPGERRPTRPDPEIIIRDHMAGMTHHLELTAEQQEAIRQILDEKMPLMSELLRRSEETNRRVSEAFAAPKLDVEQFNMRVRQASLSRTRADSLSAVILLAEAAVLTAEQRIKFAKVAPVVYANPRRVQPAHRHKP